jgi:hypothetical protein
MQSQGTTTVNSTLVTIPHLKELFDSFSNKGWNYSESNETHIIFKKDELIEQFQFIINKNEITVKVPIRSSDDNVIIYSTKFTSYYEASEFILMHLQEYK